MNSQYIDVNGLRIHYYQAGTAGSPVLLLHGGGTDSAWLSWALTIPALAQTHRVFAPDLPGYGESARPNAPYSMDYYIALLPRLMDALGIERASLVGVSMGGGIALGFALRYPQQVERLVLVDSYGLQTRAPWQRLSALLIRLPWLNAATWWLIARSRPLATASLKALFADPSRITPELMDDVMAEVRRPAAGRAWQAFQRDEVRWGGLRTNYLDELGRIAAPVLLVHGAQDSLVPLECQQEAARRLPNARLEVLERCGHWPQRECPEEFNRLVAAFLEG
jgi:pimeloyl-ACP methyl ester carboxylesterase